MSEKLQKVLARAGLASRRAIETWISAGRITINGKVAKLGDRVEPNDTIQVDHKTIQQPDHTESQLLIYHKPEGEICTRSDPQGRPTVFEHLPPLSSGRWINIGRLDLNTSGLLLLTTDGELAHQLMHPSFALEREYLVRVLGKVNADILERLKTGVKLEDGLARFESIATHSGAGANRWYRVIVTEGKNRLVRRLWESQGLQVSRLMRIRYGNITLPRTLKPGQYISINSDVVLPNSAQQKHKRS